MTTLDLRDQKDGLPPGLAHGVTVLGDTSLDKLKLYCECFNIGISDLGLIVMGPGLGHISDKAQWAADIAAYFQAEVRFEHNGVELIAFPSVVAAVLDQWAQQGRG